MAPAQTPLNLSDVKQVHASLSKDYAGARAQLRDGTWREITVEQAIELIGQITSHSELTTCAAPHA